MYSPRLLVPLYALTLLLSAFLLFSVQPLLGKMILPMLGGAPAVWNAAMVFFQAMLLAGYAWVHFTSRFLKPSWQAALHIAVLLVCAAALPIIIPDGWENPPVSGNPVFWQLAMMSVACGGPFFALAATAPLLQRWFSFTGHTDASNPYFLYAASNLGSMTALLLYPFVIEPHLIIRQQTVDWAWGYGILVLLTGACALAARNHAPPVPADQGPPEKLAKKRIALWLLLSFLPSSLMLGVTTYITTDIAAVPLLWTVPLALYTGSFIVAFARRWPVSMGSVTFLQGLVLAAIIGLAIHSYRDYMLAVCVLHLALLFLSLMCHMQLAQARPPARQLTLFYLVIAAGGVAGGLFNTLVAPRLFPFPLEYPLALAALVLVRYRSGPPPSFAGLRRVLEKMLASQVWRIAVVAATLPIGFYFMLTHPMDNGKDLGAMAAFALLAMLSGTRRPFAVAGIVLLAFYPGYSWSSYTEALAWKRNFFGILQVRDLDPERVLFFDTTIHGAQALDERYKRIPLTYYSPVGPAGDVFEILNGRKGNQNIAALGLGLGSVSCYALPRRHFDFYEINPDVVKMAQDPKLFTFLSGCGADYKIIMGDARLNLANAPDHSYDLIFVDTFSSDNIPVHMMTQEAFRLYFRKLKPGGLIAINVSNRYLNLDRVVIAIARDLHVYDMLKRSDIRASGDLFITASNYAVMAGDAETLRPFLARGWVLPIPQPSWKSWRDDYSDIVSVLDVLQKYQPRPDAQIPLNLRKAP